jgi:transketolase
VTAANPKKPSQNTSANDKKTGVFSSGEDLQAIIKKLRLHIINMIFKAGSGHPGGSLSSVEILTALYWRVLRHKPTDPQWPDRDRFILSKGHVAPVLYAALAECGYFPVAELATLRQIDSRLQGHADRTHTPGVEMSSGSLGQGLSFGIGAALAGRLNKQDYRTYVLLGDGESAEGQVWEAAAAAAQYKMDSLTAIIDVNGLQLSGCTKDIICLEPMPDKWSSFGWHTIEVNGHDLKQVLDAFEQAKKVKGKPTVIIARTIKGKGVSFMENNVNFHGNAPNAKEMEIALKELS